MSDYFVHGFYSRMLEYLEKTAESEEDARKRDAVLAGLENGQSMWDAGGDIADSHIGRAAGIGAGLGGLAGLGLGAAVENSIGRNPFILNKPTLGQALLSGAAMGSGVGAALGGGISFLNRLRYALAYNSARQNLIDAYADQKGVHAFGDAPGSSNPEIYRLIQSKAKQLRKQNAKTRASES